MKNSDTNLEKAPDLTLNEDKEVPFSEIAKRQYITDIAKKNMEKIYIDINGKTTADEGEFARFQRKYYKEFVDEFNDYLESDGYGFSKRMEEILVSRASYLYVVREEHTKEDAVQESINDYKDDNYR